MHAVPGQLHSLEGGDFHKDAAEFQANGVSQLSGSDPKVGAGSVNWSFQITHTAPFLLEGTYSSVVAGPGQLPRTAASGIWSHQLPSLIYV